MKRFYRDARAMATEGGGFGIMLDGRPVRTPGGLSLAVSGYALASAIAQEWQAQGQDIRPHTMPLTRLVSTAIDRVTPTSAAILDEVMRFGETDLLCYRAERPPELAARQQAKWQPLLDWAVLRYDAPLAVTAGVVPLPQPAGALAALRAVVAAFDPLWLTALHSATAATGSLVIGLALVEGRLDAGTAWEVSQIDEAFQIERWGEDNEAAARRHALRQDLDDACHLMALLRSKPNDADRLASGRL